MMLERKNKSLPSLAYNISEPPGETLGAVVVTHGYGEHSGRYAEVISALNTRGLITLSYDLRGHGHSEGKRGFISQFGEYITDLHDLIENAHNQNPNWAKAGKPVLLGHSLGGLISFHAALAMVGQIKGLVLSSPYFGLKLTVPAPKRFAGQLLSRFAPSISMPSGLKGEDVTRDPERAKAYDEDPLNVKTANVRWFTEAVDAQRRAFDLASQLSTPFFLLQGGSDKIADPEASRTIFEKAGSKHKEIRWVDQGYHEVFNDPDRDIWVNLAADVCLRFATKS